MSVTIEHMTALLDKAKAATRALADPQKDAVATYLAWSETMTDIQVQRRIVFRNLLQGTIRPLNKEQQRALMAL